MWGAEVKSVAHVLSLYAVGNSSGDCAYSWAGPHQQRPCLFHSQKPNKYFIHKVEIQTFAVPFWYNTYRTKNTEGGNIPDVSPVWLQYSSRKDGK